MCLKERSRTRQMLRIFALLLLTPCSLVAHAFVPLYLHDGRHHSSPHRSCPQIVTYLEESASASSIIDKNDPPSIPIAQVDVLYSSRQTLNYDPVLDRYVPSNDDTVRRSSKLLKGSLLPRIKHSFLPEGVYPSYYTFIRWRILQRFVNANVHVFGTQSLLMGLGLKSHSHLGLSAALNWVLKDALGKIVRMVWAGKMGRKFDSDAKRWRFRSSLVFALGNALEIVTYVVPSLFLLWATCANCCKQISMLTSSSTRTAIYNSFRDGKRENIGDIVAKGEAQIAFVDLLGIASGVTLSKMVGMTVRSVLGVYLVLQTLELFCLYHEIRAVEFRVLNFERLVQLVTAFVDSNDDNRDVPHVAQLPTPQQMARKEKIFLPPKHLLRRAIAFGSIGRAKLSPGEVSSLMTLFQNERFLLVVGPNVKNGNRRHLFLSNKNYPPPEEQCHIVLHTDATNIDIIKSTLALCLLRKKLAAVSSSNGSCNEDATDAQSDLQLRSSNCMEMIESAYLEADRMFPSLLKSMQLAGWQPPARFMFGRVTQRAEWPLSLQTSTSGSRSASTGGVFANADNIATLMDGASSTAANATVVHAVNATTTVTTAPTHTSATTTAGAPS